MRLLVIAAVATLLGGWVVPAAAANGGAQTAIVIRDRTPLRAAPRDSAQQQAVLWQGEAVEIRGERLDYLQVYDYRRERGGFVRASEVRRLKLTPEEAPELLAIARFVRETPGSEALGIGYVAAYIQAAPAETLRGEPGIEALDALATFADRLAERASSAGAPARTGESALTAHLDVAARYGVRFTNHEWRGRMQICYDGDAFRRVLAMKSTPEQRARAVLALTRPECVDPGMAMLERNRLNEWRAEVLDAVDAGALPPYLRNRVFLRRAGTWSALAFQRARNGSPAGAAANRALSEMTGVNRTELAEEDLPGYNDAAMRVNASRWAALPAAVGATRRLQVVATPGEPGETCVALTTTKSDGASPLARRCTYGIVWTNSVTVNREGTALALAVQTMEAWRELWVFRKTVDGWTVAVLPPAATEPETGYAEFAGWVPGGAEILVAREARGEGKYRRSFEVVRLDKLTVARQAGDPEILGAFQRWQDPAWKQHTLSLR